MKKPLLIPLLVVVNLVIFTAASTVAQSTSPNISTRAFVQTGDNVVIGGFFVEGVGPKKVLIRALGPELSQYGIPDVLANPTLELYDSSGALIASNNNWVTTIVGGIITGNQVDDIRASGHAPNDPFESAIIADLTAGNYTAIVRGVNNLTGVGLVEVYDLNPEARSIIGDISTRGYVQIGDNVMIGGFTIPGTKPKGIILRAIGPELSKYGIANPLADPTLELYDSTGALIASNDNWQHTAIGGVITADQVRDIFESGLVPNDPNESVINATLLPGNYTAIVRGVNNTTGVALLAGHRTSPTYTWTGTVDSHWENSANWIPNGVPEKGDFAAIPTGTANSPSISDRDIEDIQITLGSSVGGSVNLSAADVNFTKRGLAITGGAPGPSPVVATLSCLGNVSFALAGKMDQQEGVKGTMTVEAMGGALTIDAENNTFTLKTMDNGSPKPKPVLNDQKALVSQESALFFKGRNIVTQSVETKDGTVVPVIQIEGAADIAEGVTLGGNGILTLESGGHLSVEGTVDSGEQIDFTDRTGRISIDNPTEFLGTLGFPSVAGARMDFPHLQAQSAGVDPSSEGRVLKLYPEPNQAGHSLAVIKVQTIDESTLFQTSPPHVPVLTGSDFRLSNDGKGGTLVTYAPQNRTYLEQSMPVPLIAFRGSKVPLRTIFSQSFGTSQPGFYGIKLLRPARNKNEKHDFFFWSKLEGHPEWIVNGSPITKPQVITRTDIDTVELQVGNNICCPAQFDARVTPASSGPESEVITYSVWTVDPNVANKMALTPGKPTTADIGAAARSLYSTFPDVPNTNECNWIADNVAAVAGASMPLPNTDPDPTNNVEGGFWRIAYTGARPNPVTNWFSLVVPGDVIRMQHLFGGGHTTTALTRQHPDGTITVYSNGVRPYISIHDSTAEQGTNPASITMYRLDPNQQYLILGTSLGEVIQGSVYDNLIKPGGGADVIIAGPNNNEIKDITANLNGITVRKFHPGDVLNFTNLDPNGATAQYDATTGILTVSRYNHQAATVTLPGLRANAQFSVTPNSGGSNITLLP